ncbi:hypothetical protein SLA_0972 [Streptomyces laurentii]|uniref:Uncharacterized protein n=1 Tax=Streptomyces laurentii TaxID=39478 RepID=A0A160NW49_STRLU|nr:hypothetical protein SLA_0972 [Streptomyces laurentii]
MTAFLTLLGGLVIVIAGLCAEWPWWGWPASFGALLALAGAALLRAHRRRPVIPPEHLLEPDRPIPPVERWEEIVRDVSLPSASPDYDFLVTARVRWVPVDVPHGAREVSGAGLALDAVLTRAQVITRGQSPQRGSLVQHQLSGELGTMQPDVTGRVLAMAEDITVRLSDADRERLDKLATVRKDEAVWEHERKWEKNKRAYLGEDVLASTSSAVVWWLAKNDDKVDKAVADIGLLAQLASVANDTPVPERLRPYVEDPHQVPSPGSDTAAPPDTEDPEPRDTVAETFTRFMEETGLTEDDPVRGLFLRRVAEAARAARMPGADTLERLADEADEPFDDPFPDGSDDPDSPAGSGGGNGGNRPGGGGPYGNDSAAYGDEGVPVL